MVATDSVSSGRACYDWTKNNVARPWAHLIEEENRADERACEGALRLTGRAQMSVFRLVLRAGARIVTDSPGPLVDADL